MIWRFAIWYWVLSVTETETFSSFAAIPFGEKLERKGKCELKGTRHNGRSGKNGVYNPLHNDRRFNPEHSEHIDNERVRQNIYWDCYQGYTTMEDRGKEDNFSFTMQSIGMTGKQLRRLTVYEGIYYAVGADIIGGAVAAILAVTVLKSALNGPSMWFFTLNITLVPVLVIGVLYLLLAAVIPLIVLHFFNKGTVVERLRTSE